MLPANALQQYKRDGQFRRLFRHFGKTVYRVLQHQKEIAGEPNQLNQRELEFVLKSFNLRNERLGEIIAGATLTSAVLIAITILALIGQRNALIGQVRTARQAAEAFLDNCPLDAVIEALKAQAILKQNPLLQAWKPDSQLQAQVEGILGRTVHDTQERYRLWHREQINSAQFSPDGNTIHRHCLSRQNSPVVEPQRRTARRTQRASEKCADRTIQPGWQHHSHHLSRQHGNLVEDC